MQSSKVFLIIVTLILMAASAWAQEAVPMKIRRAAQKAYQDGNWKDALELYRQLSLETKTDPKKVGADFTQAWQCLRQLGRLDELDNFRDQVIERHGNNWRLLQDVARSYSQNTHWGYMVAGRFHRGDHRGGGKYVNTIQRDRVRALQLMHQAMNLAEADSTPAEVAQFYLEFARLI